MTLSLPIFHKGKQLYNLHQAKTAIRKEESVILVEGYFDVFRLVLAGLAPNGPAEKAGVKVGDVIVDVAGDKPVTLADLWRRVWRTGPPGVEVPIKMFRKDRAVTARLKQALAL